MRAIPPARALLVSVLFNEPKLLKYDCVAVRRREQRGFSALQRAEIAEIQPVRYARGVVGGFSALQRAEIAEIDVPPRAARRAQSFQCSSTSRNC